MPYKIRKPSKPIQKRRPKAKPKSKAKCTQTIISSGSPAISRDSYYHYANMHKELHDFISRTCNMDAIVSTEEENALLEKLIIGHLKKYPVANPRILLIGFNADFINLLLSVRIQFDVVCFDQATEPYVAVANEYLNTKWNQLGNRFQFFIGDTKDKLPLYKDTRLFDIILIVAGPLGHSDPLDPAIIDIQNARHHATDRTLLIVKESIDATATTTTATAWSTCKDSTNWDNILVEDGTVGTLLWGHYLFY